MKLSLSNFFKDLFNLSRNLLFINSFFNKKYIYSSIVAMIVTFGDHHIMIQAVALKLSIRILGLSCVFLIKCGHNA